MCSSDLCYQNHRHWRASEALCHHQRFGNKLPSGLIYISRERCLIRCHLLQFWKIFIFMSPDDMQFQSGFGAFFRCSSGIQWRRQWQPTPVHLPGKSHGRRSLVGCSPWGREESDMAERLHFHFHFYALEKAMAAHSSVLAWGSPGMGSHRVGHD